GTLPAGSRAGPAEGRPASPLVLTNERDVEPRGSPRASSSSPARAAAAGGGKPLAAACVNSGVRQSQPGMVQPPYPREVLTGLKPPEKTSGEICGALNPWLTSSSVVSRLNFQQL